MTVAKEQTASNSFGPGIRARLFALILLACAPPVGSMFYSAFESRQVGIEDAKNDLREMLKLIAIDLETMIRGSEQLLLVLAEVPAVRQLEKEACSRLFAGLVNEYKHYTSIYATTKSGEVVCSGIPSEGRERSVNVRGRDYFDAVINTGRPARGQPVIGLRTGKPVLPLAHPLTDASGAVTGMVGTSLDLTRYVESFAQISLQPGFIVAIHDSEGRFLFRYPELEKWIGKIVPEAPITRIILANKTGATAEVAGVDGVVRIFAFSPLTLREGSDFWLVMGVDRDKLLKDVGRIFSRNLWLLGIVTLAALIAAWVLGNFIIRRQLDTLVRAAQRIGQGDYGTRVGGPYRYGELGSLAKGFDDMAAAMQRHVEEITQAEKRLRRLNRTLSVLSGINSAIVRIRDRQKLFEEACRIAVEHGNFGMAWISELDPVTLDVTPVAYGGTETGEFVTSKTTARADLPLGQGIVGRAIRAKDLVFVNDLAADPDVGSAKRREAIRRGYRSVIALPLLVEGAAFGTLSLWAKEPDFFDEDELKLLRELSGDISFAVRFIEQQKKLVRLSRIQAVLSGINSAIVHIHDRQELFEEACRIAVEHGGFGIAWIGMVDPQSLDIIPAACAGVEAESFLATSPNTARPDTPLGQGIVGRAVRERRAIISNDITAERTPGGVRRQEAIRRGYRSLISLPLLVEDAVVGAMSLFAKERDFFDEDEIALLDEVAADVSFALRSIAGQEKLEYLSYYDTLTGLPNRQLFVDRLSQQLHSRSDEPRMVALILLDIERLRNVNETLGRHGGDELLRLVARRLERAFNGPDYIARVSADSFGAVIRGVRNVMEITHVVERQVLACFRELFLVNDKELRVAAKTGIAMFPADGRDADTLFRNTEAALRKAKDAGERFLFYAAEMNAQAAQSLSLETRVHRAVEAQQFVLHYQPKVELANRRVCGLEALIRWNDPETGLVPPGSFIPVLEETGLILEVGRWALARALADYSEWTARGRGVPRIAVNVSALQLQREDFVDVVTGVVRQAGGLPQGLEIEITESMLMKDVEASIRKLSVLRELGIQVAVDDFGTGYSSLSYLARLPIDIVKIDRSFISGVAGGADAAAIVIAMIALAHSLNLRVVAEGVETEEQAQLLRLLKCDEMQGYLISRPLPAAEVEARFLGAAAAT
ncbi:MAG: EAL domain-containing protein [Betaproteobacteria bacterium]|nr:EAL domain-containing protein [Betaproteobacteria bacterium]